MPVAIRIKQGGLEKALSSLDIDEGVRIESGGKKKKMFVNRSTSGIFVVQIGEEEFCYLDSAAQVVKLADKIFGKKYSAYAY
ncbi:hypothetical protein [Nitrososphaera viennensis]|uniref:Uncharacterized protein n=2 Tax=Nitrososphaera viennensis TaxID=1034015 RepID=A0A060HPN9_9ARCH|nr:hypothetical protein [Nitrososphaera viennensis]AIC17105.1 hypothetical protein NVIE_028310 [Nitrososphaera viennensis EN76]UVS68998.1 hypothetical protein NWT39_13965 [Nitrososphaera viennensis]